MPACKGTPGGARGDANRETGRPGEGPAAQRRKAPLVLPAELARRVGEQATAHGRDALALIIGTERPWELHAIRQVG
eukprot:9131103-Alexandrium_andersonii.AAC.1